MWRDLLDKEKIRRGLLLALYLVLTLLLQNTAFTRFRLLGVHALILPSLVIAAAMFHGSVWGGVFGLFAGLLGDMGFPESTVLLLSALPLLGFSVGLLAEHLVSRSFPAYLVVAALGLLAVGLLQALRVWIFHGAGFGAPLMTALKQTLVSIPFSVPFYFISRAAARRARNL